jgi:hypothetical protein
MKTLKDIRDAVIADLDLYDEDFAEVTDLNRWIREGVEIAESAIHRLYADYFLSIQNVTLSSNSIDYPDDIYANKIRAILATGSDGSVYEIRKSKDVKGELMSEMLGTNSTNDTLVWFPMNDATNGRKIRFAPTESANGEIKIMYIRNAKRLVNDADVCDIVEFDRFIIQHAKTQAYMKDGDPRTEASMSLEMQYKQDMEASLKDMAADMDNEMMQDMSFYEEMV